MSSSAAIHSADVWYLPDEPVRENDRDAFGHADVANNILAMVREPETGRRMIGLVGPFGVGKSTVIELLRQALTGDSSQVLIRVSAERHEMEDFHRSFVFSVAERLIEQGLAKRSEVDKVIESLEYASSRSWSDLTLAPFMRYASRAAILIRESIGKRIALYVVLTVVVLGIVTTGLALSGFFGQNTTTALLAWFGAVAGAVALAATIPLVLTVWSAVGKAIGGAGMLKPGQSTSLRPRAEAADEYERTFARLSELVAKRLVIAVDDVDRMAASDILPALNAIRTFQLTVPTDRRPTFIVSVDERVIAQALISEKTLPAVGNDRQHVAEEFLNRLFTLRQPMPPHVGGDLRAYARDLLRETAHEGARRVGTQLDSVLNVLVHDGVNDPRHVLRLLNGFFGDYRLAYRREQQDAGRRSLSRGVVTANPIALARMSVLRVDFPTFYEALIIETRLLDIVEALVRGEAPDYDPGEFHRRIGIPQDDSSFEALRRFVGRTATWSEPVTDLLPFLYLGQTTFERTVGSADARRARSLLANRQIAGMREMLESVREASPERRAAILDLLVDATRTLEGLELNNAVEVLVENAELAIAVDRGLGMAVADALYRAPGASPSLAGLIALLPTLETDQQEQSVARALTRPANEAEPAWMSILLDRRGELESYPHAAAAAKGYLSERVAELSGNAGLGDIEPVLPHFASVANSDLADAILTAAFLAVTRGEEDMADERIGSIVAIGNLLPTGSLSDELKSALQAVLVGGTSTVAAAAGLALYDVVRPTESQQIADLGLSFLRGSMDMKAGVINDDFGHENLETGEPLLADMVSAANAHNWNKQRLASYLGQMLGSAIKAWGSTYPSINSLVATAIERKASDVVPVIQPLVEIWAAKGEALDEDEIDLLRLLVSSLDSLPAQAISPIQAAMEAALLPTGEDFRRHDAIAVLPAALATANGKAWTSSIIDAAAATLSNARAATVSASETIVAAAVHGKPTQANATNVLSGIQGRVLPYGLVAESIELLVSYPWPTEQIAQAMALIEQSISGASDAHLIRVFQLLKAAPHGSLSTGLTGHLEVEAARLAREGVDGQSLGLLFRHQSPQSSLVSALAIGETSMPLFAEHVHGLEGDVLRELALAAPALVAKERLDDPTATKIVELMDAAAPDMVADGVQDMVVEQVLQDGDQYRAADYGLLIAAAAEATTDGVVSILDSAWMKSANEVTASLPVLEAIAFSNKFDAAVAESASRALRRWARDEPDRAIATKLATSIALGTETRAKSRIALGARGPRTEPAKSAYLAAKAALGK